MQRKSRFQYAAVYCVITIIFGTIYVVNQQFLRQTANDPQIQISRDIAAAIDSGKETKHLIPEDKVDMKKSMAPFFIIYDDDGKPLDASAFLDGSMPSPPLGVFSQAKKGEDRITWQPRADLRFAVVINRYNTGYVLAGRSLEESEKRTKQFSILILAGWIISLIVVTISFFFRPNHVRGGDIV